MDEKTKEKFFRVTIDDKCMFLELFSLSQLLGYFTEIFFHNKHLILTKLDLEKYGSTTIILEAEIF